MGLGIIVMQLHRDLIRKDPQLQSSLTCSTLKLPLPEYKEVGNSEGDNIFLKTGKFKASDNSGKMKRCEV